jgi:hypothetical protein
MRWAGHVARTGRGEVLKGFWWRNTRKGDHLEDLNIYGRMILKLKLKK